MSVPIRVAILKSRLYKGGVAQVLGCMIKALNDSGIVPDILVLRSDLDAKDFLNLYQIKINFRLKFIGPDLKMPYEWHFLYFNLLSRPYAKKYDLFINSNNTSFLSPHGIRTITYTHFPRKNRVMSTSSSTHFPELINKSFWDIKNDPFYIARAFYHFNNKFGEKEIIVANSVYTAEQIKSSYPALRTNPLVIYPPVKLSEPQIIKKKLQVVSLGRISAEKRQLEQIEVAKHFPEVDFYILGFSDLKKYYQNCQKKIRSENLNNVHLLVNQNYLELEKILSESSIFLHSVRNEPFGISTIQAISKNCLPLVHNSGGSKEIVLHDELMYSDLEECIQKLKKLINISSDQSSNLMNSIDLNLYSTDSFMEKFRTLINETLR